MACPTRRPASEGATEAPDITSRPLNARRAETGGTNCTGRLEGPRITREPFSIDFHHPPVLETRRRARGRTNEACCHRPPCGGSLPSRRRGGCSRSGESAEAIACCCGAHGQYG